VRTLARPDMLLADCTRCHSSHAASMTRASSQAGKLASVRGCMRTRLIISGLGHSEYAEEMRVCAASAAKASRRASPDS
jgi:hypothetical protein